MRNISGNVDGKSVIVRSLWLTYDCDPHKEADTMEEARDWLGHLDGIGFPVYIN